MSGGDPLDKYKAFADEMIALADRLQMISDPDDFGSATSWAIAAVKDDANQAVAEELRAAHRKHLGAT